MTEDQLKEFVIYTVKTMESIKSEQDAFMFRSNKLLKEQYERVRRAGVSFPGIRNTLDARRAGDKLSIFDLYQEQMKPWNDFVKRTRP